MKLRNTLTLSLSVLLATQSVATIAFAANQRSEVSASEVAVAPGISATIVKEVNSGRISTTQQLEHRLKNLSIEEREGFLREAKNRLASLQVELNAKVIEANTAGKAFISAKLQDISSMSSLAFLVSGLAAQYMMGTPIGDGTTLYKNSNKAFQNSAKVLGVLSIISGVVAISSLVADTYMAQSLAVNTDDLERLKKQVSLEERNVDMLLNDLLVAREISIALSGKTTTNRMSSQVNISSILQLDDATKDLFKQTLITSSEGAETFIKTVKNLPIKSRIALLNDAIRALELKQSELSLALSSSGLSQKVAISRSLSDLSTLGVLGAIVTGGTAGYHLFSGKSGEIMRFGAKAERNMIRSVRVLVALTAFQAVAATTASWVNDYYYLASKEQVDIIKGQVETLTGQLQLIRNNLKEAQEINESTAVTKNK